MPSSRLRAHSSKLPRKHGLASPFQRLNIPTAFRLYVRMLGSASQRIGKFRKQAQSYFTTIYQGELNNPQNPLNDYTLSIYGTTNTPRQDRSGFQRSPSQRFIGICWKVRRQGRVVDGFRGTKTGSRCFQTLQHGLNSQQHPTLHPIVVSIPPFLSAGQSLPLPQSLHRSLPIKSSVLELPQPSESKDLLSRFASRNGLRLRSAAWDGPSWERFAESVLYNTSRL